MKKVVCESLEEVRANIDRIDLALLALIAERGGFVRQAARFKKTSDDVRAPQRVEQVIAQIRSLAEKLGAEPDVAEKIWRTMIGAFIETEMREHSATSGARK